MLLLHCSDATHVWQVHAGMHYFQMASRDRLPQIHASLLKFHQLSARVTLSRSITSLPWLGLSSERWSSAKARCPLLSVCDCCVACLGPFGVVFWCALRVVWVWDGLGTQECGRAFFFQPELCIMLSDSLSTLLALKHQLSSRSLLWPFDHFGHAPEPILADTGRFIRHPAVHPPHPWQQCDFQQ